MRNVLLIAVPVWGVAAVLLGVPGLGRLNLETTLCMGVVGGPWVASLSARARLVPLHALSAGVAASSGTIAIFGARGWLFGFCDPAMGLLWHLYGHGAGLVIAAALGSFCGAAFSSRGVATVVALVSVVGTFALGLLEFWATPGVFVYNLFAGWFPGPLYDRSITLLPQYATYRWVSLGWVVLFVLGHHHLRTRGRWVSVRFAVALTLGSVAWAVWVGDALGHRSSTARMGAVLHRSANAGPCRVFGPVGAPGRELDLLARECAFQVQRQAQALGVKPPGQLNAYFFASAEQKRDLMGAAHTYVAKPWRREVYLQFRPWPHAVLAHEIAHVIAAEVGAGPLRVSGALGGWIPNMAIVEGTAEALSWRARDGRDLHQWAWAMRETVGLPDPDQLFGLGFVTLSGPRAYTAMGSLVHFMMEQPGGDAAVRSMYRRGTLAQRQRWLNRWQRHLDTVDGTRADLMLARTRFEGKGFFQTTCPRMVARVMGGVLSSLFSELRAEDGTWDSGILSCALSSLRMARGRAGDHPALLRTMGMVHAARGETAAARSLMNRLRRAGSGDVSILPVRLAMIDHHIRSGNRRRAQTHLAELLGGLPFADQAVARNLVLLDVALRHPERANTILAAIAFLQWGKPHLVLAHLNDRALHGPEVRTAMEYLLVRAAAMLFDHDLALWILRDRAPCAPTLSSLCTHMERAHALHLAAVGRLFASQARWDHHVRMSTSPARELEWRLWRERLTWLSR